MAFRTETDRLVLRSWGEGDCKRFYDIMNTPAVMRYLGGEQSYEKWCENCERLQSYECDFGHTFWIVERKEDGEMLGFCGLKKLNYDGAPNQGEMEIGWRFRESAWGQGYAYEAAAHCLDLAFDRFEAERVSAVTVTDNVASQKLMRKLGMIEDPELAYTDPVYSPKYGPARQWLIDASAWRSRG
ncbi:GNAT family N-acetyltransferase [Sphingomicrobium clamense]|uniref:GNAT family N-acetyltransferase n=1 Tax=Sphingomicrobium clamense TaxID=2851013 RepID=A0ABS6V7L9_9SPHN|nr:GNAT family N-acetyltransferase [Sphingomicrobium sp. B8]MBW0145546.1 GNAT family N-acetyltransferase [Sphingomicrobium sp. B8]